MTKYKLTYFGRKVTEEHKTETIEEIGKFLLSRTSDPVDKSQVHDIMDELSKVGKVTVRGREFRIDIMKVPS